MNAIPCVDVVVPVFNGRETIQTALFSVLSGQGGLVRRIIVVDDGSVDGTADAVKSLGTPLIQIVRTANRGVAQARNLGITESSAEWVAFLDADDMWLPGKLQAQLAAAEEHCAGFVSCSIGAQSVMKSGLISAKALARRGNFVATSSVLVKRSVLKQISPVFTPTMSFAEDYLAWLKCVALRCARVATAAGWGWGQTGRVVPAVASVVATVVASAGVVGSPSVPALRGQWVAASLVAAWSAAAPPSPCLSRGT